MNAYETLFLEHKDEFEKLIKDLTLKTLNESEKAEAEAELAEIGKYIHHDVDIVATFNYEPQCNYITGTATFDNVEAFKEAKDELSGWEHFDTLRKKYTIDWDGEPDDGDITIDDSVEVGKIRLYSLDDETAAMKHLKRS